MARNARLSMQVKWQSEADRMLRQSARGGVRYTGELQLPKAVHVRALGSREPCTSVRLGLRGRVFVRAPVHLCTGGGRGGVAAAAAAMRARYHERPRLTIFLTPWPAPCSIRRPPCVGVFSPGTSSHPVARIDRFGPTNNDACTWWAGAVCVGRRHICKRTRICSRFVGC